MTERTQSNEPDETDPNDPYTLFAPSAPTEPEHHGELDAATYNRRGAQRQAAKYPQGRNHLPDVEHRELMKPGEVAKLFRVDPKTVTRWAAAGRINFVKTPGKHTRFFKDEIYAMLAATEPDEG